jgi:hypothetical protein
MRPSDLNELDKSVTAIKLDGDYEIHYDWWANLTMNWKLDSSMVSGSIMFFDALDFAESIPLGNNNTISITLKDSQEKDFTYTFGITDVVKSPGTSGRKVMLKFMDTMSVEGATTFISKGYKDQTTKQIVQDVYDNILTVNPEQYEQNITQDGNKYSTYVLNGNKNLSKNLNILYDLQGMLYYKTRTKVNAIYPHEIFADKPKELVYSIQSENPDYIGIIDEWDYASGFNLDAYTPDTKKVWFSPFDKQVQTVTTDLDEANDNFTKKLAGDYTLDDLKYNLVDSIESQTNYVDPTRQLIKQQIMKAVDKNVNEIFINGTFDNNVGDIVTLDIPTSTGNLDEVDEQASGLWIIVEITDHINTTFFQTLSLQRIQAMPGKPAQ